MKMEAIKMKLFFLTNIKQIVRKGIESVRDNRTIP